MRAAARLLAMASLFALPARAEAQPYAVTFAIDLRAEVAAGRFDPAVDGVGVRGGMAPLQWEATLPARDPDGDRTYEATVSFPRAPFGGQAVTYKFKIDRAADPGAGWESGRNRQLFLRQPEQTVRRAFDAPPPPVEISRVGTIRVHPDFPSKFVPPRTVQVYLPPDYEGSRRRFPVLYLHDGQHAFDGAEMGMEWQVDETAERLIRAGEIAPWIVVAIANTEARTDEYAPTVTRWTAPDGTPRSAGGGAGRYGRFLVEELKPFVDRTYRTRRGRAATAIGGASLGGLVSLWLALDRPDLFGQALVVSPAAHWDDDLVIRRVAALPSKPRLRIHLDVGALEGERLVAGTLRLRDALLAKGWKPGTDFEFVEQPDGQHDEVSWASRVEGMLRFLDGG